MATFNIKSTVLTNRDATPKVLTDALVAGGEISECEGYAATGGAADGSGTFYRLCQVPSNARMSGLILQASAFGSGAAIDVGVYWPTNIPVGAGLSAANASAVINTQLFASALGMSAATAVTDIINSSGNNTIAKQEQCLWQAAGLSSDPGIMLDIVAGVQTALAASGFIGLKARYVKQ